MTDFHSIYQQEINVLANSMRGRQMRNIWKNKQPKALHFSDILLVMSVIEILLILPIPLFTGDCWSLYKVEKKCWEGVKKGTLQKKERPLAKNQSVARLKSVGNAEVPGKSVSEIDPVVHIHTIPLRLTGFRVNIGVRFWNKLLVQNVVGIKSEVKAVAILQI